MGATHTAASTAEDSAREQADGLRELADWIEAHPDIAERMAPPYLVIIADDADDMAHKARALGGKRSKHVGDEWVDVERKFGPVRVTVTARRENVCERVVVGTTTVEIPAEPARPATPARTETIERTKWVCPDSIMGGAS